MLVWLLFNWYGRLWFINGMVNIRSMLRKLNTWRSILEEIKNTGMISTINPLLISEEIVKYDAQNEGKRESRK